MSANAMDAAAKYLAEIERLRAVNVDLAIALAACQRSMQVELNESGGWISKGPGQFYRDAMVQAHAALAKAKS